ncbi:aspartate/glutamate racemase family protein [Alteromonadaceae bacterium BrNp21-10]|nr:aspartate/glutamate racemase family protein [Alteromonadaceae bacterium BrNp21-10]
MKTIGLIGGMSWESTARYYSAINKATQSQLGGLHSAKICLYSVDFAPIAQWQREDNWSAMAETLKTAAKAVEAGGADMLLICANTMHKIADEVQQAVNIPLVHIVDATAEQLLADGVTKIGLLGTRFTMQLGFYKDRLSQVHGIDTVVPNEAQQTLVHDIIYQELCLGQVKDTSRQTYLDVMQDLKANGAQAIILGCTEIAMLISPEDTDMPLYDTTQLHGEMAVRLALANES